MVVIFDVDRGYVWVILGGNIVFFSFLFDYFNIKNDIFIIYVLYIGKLV